MTRNLAGPGYDNAGVAACGSSGPAGEPQTPGGNARDEGRALGGLNNAQLPGPDTGPADPPGGTHGVTAVRHARGRGANARGRDMTTTSTPATRVAAGMLHAGDAIWAPIPGRRRLTLVTIERTLRGSTGTRNIVVCSCRTPAGRRHYTIPLDSTLIVTRLHENTLAAA
jgi:hypothetical protein